MNKIKSICIIGQGLNGGGIERAYTSLANYYTKQKLIISIILLFKTDQFYDLDSDIKIYFPEIERAGCNKYIYAVKLLPYIRNTISNINPDVVLSFNEWYNSYVIIATMGLNISLFVTDRMSPNMKLSAVNTFAKKLIYKKAAGVIAQTTYAAEKIQESAHPKNITVIPNPVNVIKTKKVNKKKSIVTLGRLSKEKGQKYLIEAFGKLNTNEWELNIIGDGPERMNLENMVNDLCAGKVVKFHGHLKEFSQIMSEAEIFVLPSLSEGFPNALIEAMSVPLACISSDCIAGPKDIINNRINGILFKVADSDDLALKINELINDEKLRNLLATNAYNIRNTLNFKVIAGRYLSFMQKTISDKQ
ncbi:MAG: glycosyltransferase [Chlorobiaceae bacterium]|nr:glycosyltransferase [Chlorobiaceae bacterium]